MLKRLTKVLIVDKKTQNHMVHLSACDARGEKPRKIKVNSKLKHMIFHQPRPMFFFFSFWHGFGRRASFSYS